MNTTYRQLQLEIGQWAERNFDYFAPELGCAEEIGELTHAVLKRNQKIRKQASTEFFRESALDSIADAGIYLLHWCHINNEVIEGFEHFVPISEQENNLLGYLHLQAGRLILTTSEGGVALEGSNAKTLAMHIMAGLASFLSVLDPSLQLLQEIERTWQSVKQRDWRKFPINGLTK
jgi:NTP pyrophosphatase (non-canonical NTP hydrolase)